MCVHVCVCELDVCVSELSLCVCVCELGLCVYVLALCVCACCLFVCTYDAFGVCKCARVYMYIHGCKCVSVPVPVLKCMPIAGNMPEAPFKFEGCMPSNLNGTR